jgi:drug/metabolite transporter (DMT)-like permease
MLSKQGTLSLFLIGLASAALFGTATPASKFLLADTPVVSLAGLLYLGGAMGVLPVALRGRPFKLPWQAGRPTFLRLAGAVGLGGVLGPLLLLLGLKLASAGSVSLWLNLEFVATVFLGRFVFHEHMTVRSWIAAGGTLLAALLLAGSEGDIGFASVVLVALACLCWGYDNHFTALIDGITPAQTTFWKSLLAGAFNLSLGVALAGGVGSLKFMLMALLVGAVSYGASVTLYIITAQGLGATRSQMLFSTAPFFGVLLSVTLLGEPFTRMQMLAAAIIMVSLVVLFSEKHRHVHRHRATVHQHGHRHPDDHHQHTHNGLADTSNHAHPHVHEATEHDHGHWPDLHHRHRHQEDEDGL